MIVIMGVHTGKYEDNQQISIDLLRENLKETRFHH